MRRLRDRLAIWLSPGPHELRWGDHLIGTVYKGAFSLDPRVGFHWGEPLPWFAPCTHEWQFESVPLCRFCGKDGRQQMRIDALA